MSNLFDDIRDALSGGQVSKVREEEGRLLAYRSRLETLVKNYNYWSAQGTILSKSLYKITIMAFNEVRKLNDIFTHLTVRQGNIIEQPDKPVKSRSILGFKTDEQIDSLESQLPCTVGIRKPKKYFHWL